MIKELGAEAIYRRGRQELGLPWTQLMDHCLLVRAPPLLVGCLLSVMQAWQRSSPEHVPPTGCLPRLPQEAAQQLGRTPADVRAALHRLPVHPSLVQLVADAAGGLDGSRAAGSSVTQLILSDANTVSCPAADAWHPSAT